VTAFGRIELLEIAVERRQQWLDIAGPRVRVVILRSVMGVPLRSWGRHASGTGTPVRDDTRRRVGLINRRSIRPWSIRGH
jgi:hypothetical protein